MTAEEMLLTALSVVSSALVVVVKLLWGEAMECKRDRKQLRQELEDVKTKSGEMHGFNEAVKRCPTPGCTFRDEDARPARHTPSRPPWHQANPQPAEEGA